MKELITQHASELITGIIAVVIGWFGKTKMSKKIEDAELTKHIQGIYKDMIADTDRMIDQNTQEIAELNKKLQQKDLYWQNKYSILQRENKALKQRISELEKH